MEQFIREKIKDKPVNKKRMARNAAAAALYGAVFATVAGIVFLVVLKLGGISVIGLPDNASKDADGKMETVQQNTQESTQESMQSSTQTTDPVVVNTEGTGCYFSLKDYQDIQNELYRIGTSANKFIVQVTGVVDSTDIFNNMYETEGYGVGVIIRDNGKQLVILTEKAVVEGADKLSVTFVNDYVADAAIIKYDSNTGMAVISVDKSLVDDTTLEAIAVAELGTSNLTSRGTTVIALESNHAILTGCITSTVNKVSAQDNNYSVLTTDIASNKTQSGVLINTDGRIIGLVLSEVSSAEESSTLAAVGISDVIPVIEKLETGAAVPYIGVSCTTVTDKIANRYNIPKGVYIKTVTMDSPAFMAGLQSGDVIVGINETDISTVANYNSFLMTLNPDDMCTVKAKRKGSNGYTEINCQVKIGVMN